MVCLNISSNNKNGGPRIFLQVLEVKPVYTKSRAKNTKRYNSMSEEKEHWDNDKLGKIYLKYLPPKSLLWLHSFVYLFI